MHLTQLSTFLPERTLKGPRKVMGTIHPAVKLPKTTFKNKFMGQVFLVDDASRSGS